MLGINPFVFRLCTFDPEALDYVEKEYKVPKQVVVAFLVSLANLDNEMVDMLMEKDLHRVAYLETEKNNKSRKDMKRKDELRRKREAEREERRKKLEQRRKEREQRQLER